MEQTLQRLADYLEGHLIGDGAIPIHGVNNLEDVQSGEITFAEDAKHLLQAKTGLASAVIVSLHVRELGTKSGISVENPKLAFALALELFYPQPRVAAGIHPSAIVGNNLSLGEGASIGANTVVGDDVRIGRGTVIESGVHVGDGVTMGEGCLLGPHVVVYRQTHLGNRVRIHGGSVLGGDGFGYVFHDGRYVKIPQVGNVVIEDDVEIGCNVCVDRATIGSTIIKRGTKIDNLVQIAHNDFIGEHVVITGQCGLSGSVTVGNYVVMGGRTGIVDHVEIGAKAQIGAASVVTKSVAPGEIVWGYPARNIRQTKREMALLARLPDILKRFARKLV